MLIYLNLQGYDALKTHLKYDTEGGTNTFLGRRSSRESSQVPDLGGYSGLDKDTTTLQKHTAADDETRKVKSRDAANESEITLTTDFNLISSDFNAKEKRKNSSDSPSQLNVPDINESYFSKSDDLDQLSFNESTINRESEIEQRSSVVSNIGNNKSMAKDGAENVEDRNPEILLKKQKDLLAFVADFGLQNMHELYDVKEKEIYEAGLFLPSGSPGSYLAAFNQQPAEVKKLSRFGYASLRATARLVEELADSKLRQEIFNVTVDDTKDFPEISLLDTSLHDDCPLKNNPRCPNWKHLFRTIDGTCNNLKRPWWGAKFQPLKRFLAPHYSDGLETIRQSVRGGPLPSARLISTTVHWDLNVNSKSVTHMLMQWGQFIDHDMTSSSQSRGFNGSVPRCCDAPINLQHPDCLPIEVPSNDPFFGRFGIRCLEFLRSAPSSRVGCGLGPREQVNQVTSYIDGSMIYGNSDREAAKLRLFRNGMLKYSRMPQRLPLLPQDRERGEFCRNSNSDFFCLFSGDARMNEQPGLMAIHVVFLRLHNRLARNMAHLNPEWSDERIYQETRKIIGAILQHITYREFLPIVLGHDVMKVFDIDLTKDGYYNGYSEKISGSAANSFATAAFRFGHSMVQGKFLKWDDIRKEVVNNVSLHEELLDPGSLHRFGAVDNLMMGMCMQEAQKRDEHFSVELTNHLFQTPNFPAGLDLAAINIQRGRDHGIPSYNNWRNPCGLRRMRTWDDLLHVMPPGSRDNFRSIYRDIDDIDLFPGGLAEFSVRGGIVGSTFACIIAQHFRNLRKGDRFWYENGGFDSSFTLSQLKAIRRVSLARVLCDNLDLIEEIQPFVFLTADSLRNKKISCRSGEIPFIDLSAWQESPKGKLNLKQNKPTAIEISVPEMPETTLELEPGNEIPQPLE